MFGLSPAEILVVAVVALIFIGPDKLPDAFRALGKGIREVRRHTHDLKEHLDQDQHLGQTVRELKATLRGDDPVAPPRPRPAAGAEARPLPTPAAESTTPPHGDPLSTAGPEAGAPPRASAKPDLPAPATPPRDGDG